MCARWTPIPMPAACLSVARRARAAVGAPPGSEAVYADPWPDAADAGDERRLSGLRSGTVAPGERPCRQPSCADDTEHRRHETSRREQQRVVLRARDRAGAVVGDVGPDA